MRLRVALTAALIVPSLAWAGPQDEPGAKWDNKCVVIFSDAFRYDADVRPQAPKGESLWKRVVVAVCWSKGQEYYSIRSGEHLFREYYAEGKLVREGVGSWTFAPRVYLSKQDKDDVKDWEGGNQVMVDRTPFDDPYKEE